MMGQKKGQRLFGNQFYARIINGHYDKANRIYHSNNSITCNEGAWRC